MVVEREVTDRDQIHAGGALHLPVALTQLGRLLAQLRLRQLPTPVGLQGDLELAMEADPWKTEDVCNGHVGYRGTLRKTRMLPRRGV